jgi:hypothetical protein
MVGVLIGFVAVTIAGAYVLRVMFTSVDEMTWSDAPRGEAIDNADPRACPRIMRTAVAAARRESAAAEPVESLAAG